MEWKFLLIVFWLAVRITLSPYLQASAGVIYYVKPTDEPCVQLNSSCPSGEECHTMDDYASNSSHYFSPDHINVTLYFFCGVHNCTKRMDVKNLQKFVMKGTAGRHSVIINMISTLVPTRDPEGDNKHKYIFTNVSEVVIEELTINNISVGFEGNDCKLYGNNLSFYGPIGPTLPRISVINITGCLALFDTCTFQCNTFVRLQSRAELVIKDSDFHSYNHVTHSAIVGQDGCTVVLSGVVNFTNNTVGSSTSTYANCGGVFYLAPIAPIVRTNECCSLVLNISQDTNIYFINNTADCGGALCLASTQMNIGSSVNMTLRQNKVREYRHILNYFFGGAILAEMSNITIGENTNIQISSNIAGYGGGMYLWKNSSLVMNRNAAIKLVNNKAYSLGGAMFLEQSYFSIINAVLQLWNNTAIEAGGAISVRGSSMNIREHANVTFINNVAILQAGALYQSIAGSISIDVHSSLEFYSNSAGQGGAVYLTSPGSLIVGHNSKVIFANNSALEVGGAVYAYTHLDLPCFLFLNSNSSLIKFEKNSARRGGLHIYGASIRSIRCTESYLFPTYSYCGKDGCSISLKPNLSSTLSPVSSDPKRVCLCDPRGQPQCANLSYIFVSALSVYSGESIRLSLMVVGYDFGVTTGTVHANFLHSDFSALDKDKDQYHQFIEDIGQCSNISYTIYSVKEHEILYLQTATNKVNSYGEKSSINISISNYNIHQHGYLNSNLLSTPVFINVTVLPGCPPGFTLKDWHQGCSCYSILQRKQFSCSLANNTGYLSWNSTMWVAADTNQNNTTDKAIFVSWYCPLEHCRSGRKVIDLDTDPDKQCAFNHAGVLCGACRKGYSLAIGSSHCIKCSSDSHLALTVFFIAAGFLLVIILFVFNLTVTQGLVNGVILYANVIWIYKNILFQNSLKQTAVSSFLQVYIAWLNLDFGIETCFIAGLNTFWKTWLQFLFPLYIWSIAGVIIVACRYSSRLTNLMGSRAVPLLSTLFLLSYMKLLRTIVTVFGYSVLTQYPNGSKIVVWYRDGNLLYCQHPHIYLFITSLAALVFLCIPFTLFLLLIQCWRRISHRRGLRWINKLMPIYDACFAPLHDKHHHLFGAVLLIRGMLLFIFTMSSNSDNSLTTNLLALCITMVMLLLYVIFMGQVYKSGVVRVLDSISFLNLILLSGITLYAGGKSTAYLDVSISASFVQFCVIALLSVIKIYFKSTGGCLRRSGYHKIDEEPDVAYERIEDADNDVEVRHALDNTNSTY